MRARVSELRYRLGMRIALLLVAVVACSKTETIRADQTPVREPAPQPVAEFPQLANVPAEVAALGKTPCDPVNAVYLCGTDGTVSKAFFVGGGVMPAGLHTLKKSDGFYPVTVGLEPDRVWVLRRCIECRIPRDMIEVSALRTMKDDALASTQSKLGLPPSPLLRTPHALRDALVNAGYKRPSS
jgi:hypothetical protein